MEPSRDDFIIAIRSAFLKKGTKQRFSLTFLLLFSVVLIILGKFNFTPIKHLKTGLNEIVYRTSFVASLPEKYADYSLKAIGAHAKIYKDYSSLEEELKKLKTEKYKAKFLENENKRLKKILDNVTYSSDIVFAKVLIDKQSPFLRSIIINKGSRNGLKKGMAVLSDAYLIGKIVELNYTTSRVLLLSDLNSKIPVSLEPGSIQSILSGDGKNSGIIQYTKNNTLINVGSIIYTSGTGDLLKPGIPIGKIYSNENRNFTDFFIDFTQLRYVQVLSYIEEENK
jgi:rod shape-determining protein MreC|tara:strand:- start:1778 stop:2623 length:846 start_codon:yes stop_codon:yes gene_type:complete